MQEIVEIAGVVRRLSFALRRHGHEQQLVLLQTRRLVIPHGEQVDLEACCHGACLGLLGDILRMTGLRPVEDGHRRDGGAGSGCDLRLSAGVAYRMIDAREKAPHPGELLAGEAVHQLTEQLGLLGSERRGVLHVDPGSRGRTSKEAAAGQARQALPQMDRQGDIHTISPGL